MRAAALALCALALAACAAEDPAVAAERNWDRCSSNNGDANQRLLACTALIDAPATTKERRAAAMLRRGETHFYSANYVRAIADFGRVLRLEPNNVQALYQRGMAHYDRGAYAIAGKDFDAVLAIDPYHAEARHWRANVQDDLISAYDNQIVRLDSMIAERPADANLRNSRCWLRAINGRDLPEALADCEEGVRLAPQDQNILDSRGLVHYKLGNFDAALADYSAALALEPERGHYMFGRALALHALGRVDEANAAFAAAEAAEPGVTALYAGYGAPRPS